MHLGADRNVLPFSYSLLLAYVDLRLHHAQRRTGSASYDPHLVPSSGCATDEKQPRAGAAAMWSALSHGLRLAPPQPIDELRGSEPHSLPSVHSAVVVAVNNSKQLFRC